MGLYLDEDDKVRLMGVSHIGEAGSVDMSDPNNHKVSTIIGLDYEFEYDQFYNHGGNDAAGIYMVRTSAVPVPAALWLFGSGLGLLGWMRRKVS